MPCAPSDSPDPQSGDLARGWVLSKNSSWRMLMGTGAGCGASFFEETRWRARNASEIDCSRKRHDFAYGFRAGGCGARCQPDISERAGGQLHDLSEPYARRI